MRSLHIGDVAMYGPMCAIASPVLCKLSEHKQKPTTHCVSGRGAVNIAAMWIVGFCVGICPSLVSKHKSEHIQLQFVNEAIHHGEKEG